MATDGASHRSLSHFLALHRASRCSLSLRVGIKHGCFYAGLDLTPLKTSSCLQYRSLFFLFSCSCEPLCRHVLTCCRVYRQSYTMKEQCVIIFSIFVCVCVCVVYCVEELMCLTSRANPGRSSVRMLPSSENIYGVLVEHHVPAPFHVFPRL